MNIELIMVNKIKICLAASAGGHMSQLLKISSAWQGKDVFFVTTTEVLKKKLEKQARACVVGESNRQNAFKVLKVIWKCFKLIVSERPKVVISTGAAHGCIICYISKVFCRSKIVWIDSITNVKQPSLSGRLVRPIADLYLLQWPELAEKYPKAEYAGCII